MSESWVVLAKLAKLTIRFRIWICGFWLAATLIAAIGAANFLSVTTMSFDAPKGSEADVANEAFAKYFPDFDRVSDFAALLEVQTGHQVLDLEGLKDFSFALRDKLNSSGELVSYTSNATLWFEHQIPSPGLVNTNGNTTLIQFTIRADPTSKPALAFAKFAQKLLDEQVHQYLIGLAFYGLSSVPTLCNMAVEDTEKSMGEMDAIAMPIAVLVLWYVIRSGRLLLVPLVAMACSASLSFGIMYIVGKFTIVEQSTPSLMMSLLIAMCIDYSLFMLSRFREELDLPFEQASSGAAYGIEAGAALECDACRQKTNRCIINTMETAGFTVLLSGTTLTLSFIVLASFPVLLVSNLGVGCAVVLILTLAVHLTLVPAMLATFPDFFGQATSPKRTGARVGERVRRCCCPGRARSEAAAGFMEPASVDAQSRDSIYSVVWVQLARWTTTFPFNILLVILIVAGTVALGTPTLRMRTSDDIMLSLPRGTAASSAFQQQIASFGAGSIAPYRLMIRPLNGTVLEQGFWENSQAVVQAMASNLPHTSARDFQFLWFSGQSESPVVQWDEVNFCLQSPTFSACEPLFYGIDAFTSADRTAAFGFITLQFDPMGIDGPAWLKHARTLVADLGQKYMMHIVLVSQAANSLDIISRVYSVFPYMVIGTLSLALVLLGLAFRSIVIPLRSVFSICLTLAAVYGLAALTYQDGILEWTRMPGLSGAFKGQFWLMPVLCFSIVVGLCLDYDIFLLSRTTEFRERKMPATEAIRLGLCSTGGIITAAGIIMAIAFGGLLFSAMLDINNMAFYLVVSVLYDTFIVRCLLAPAAMSILGRWNWWPSKLSKDD